jgi:putative phosphoribosyl transferase
MHTRETTREPEVEIDAAGARLTGTLRVPAGAAGIVLFAHGSGSGRHSPRNVFVADVLHRAGVGTLLFDLLTGREEVADRVDAHLRFDIELLAERVVGALDWLRSRPEGQGRRLGLFGASTGAAAALVAAARRPNEVAAVVSRGGRPDLAGSSLGEVRAPTLLIVGSLDQAVLSLNRAALRELRAPSELVTVEGATHLFEEPGTLAEVAHLAAAFFREHLSHAPSPLTAEGPPAR